MYLNYFRALHYLFNNHSDFTALSTEHWLLNYYFEFNFMFEKSLVAAALFYIIARVS